MSGSALAQREGVRMMFQVMAGVPVGPSTIPSLRCPRCRQLGTFEHIGGAADVQVGQAVSNTPHGLILGQRRCPNPECHAHIFFAHHANRTLVSYPAERIDFDATSIPGRVVGAPEEAITCHASRCFVAAAIMVRKTLEELCRDRGATGATLKDRLTVLGSKIILPQELLDGLDDIRLLGNDAAHIESNAYDKVGEEEVETAIEFSKEVLKAVYQYSALLERIRKLKKSP